MSEIEKKESDRDTNRKAEAEKGAKTELETNIET